MVKKSNRKDILKYCFKTSFHNVFTIIQLVALKRLKKNDIFGQVAVIRNNNSDRKEVQQQFIYFFIKSIKQLYEVRKPI